MKQLSLLLISFYCLFACSCSRGPKANNGTMHLTTAEKNKLTLLLNDVYDKDQQCRQNIYATIEKHGIMSPEVKSLGKKIKTTDSLNLITIKAVIAKYGWPSSKIVGKKGNSAIFLVIQHAPEADSRNFLPLMRKAVLDSAASKQELALLEDRVAVDRGEKQKYGTQVGFDEKTKKYYVFPIDSPTVVDKRRAEMGLAPIAVHLSKWNIKWEDK